MNKVYELAEECALRRRSFIQTKTNLEIKIGFYHGAFIVSHKRFENILSYGENMSDTRLNKTIHAEEKAILNLPCLKPKKNLKKVDIIVVRTTKKGCLGLSKPCHHCIFLMDSLIKEKGYVVQSIYYTNENREVEQTTLNRLLQDEIHISKYYRNQKLKINEM
jgi:cytidine deaminase